MTVTITMTVIGKSGGIDAGTWRDTHTPAEKKHKEVGGVRGRRYEEGLGAVENGGHGDVDPLHLAAHEEALPDEPAHRLQHLLRINWPDTSRHHHRR